MARGDFHSTEKIAPVTIPEWEEHGHVGGVDAGQAYKAMNFVPYSLAVDEVDANTTYLGESVIGSSTAAAVWRVRKITVSGTETRILWADSGGWTQIWANRASLTYA